MPLTIKKTPLPSFVPLGMEEELIDLINTHAEGRFLDLDDLDLRWTFWDDNIDHRTDDNGDTYQVLGLSVEHDNECANVIVHWSNGRGEEPISRLDYMDDDNNNCAEWIYDEVTAEFGNN